MNKFTTIALSSSILFSSCIHLYYVPNVQNVPLFKEKNEYRFSGSLGSSATITQIDVQAAYSVTDNIGIMVDYMTAKDVDSESNNFGGAIGYFKPIEAAGVFEIYGGLGGGKQHHEYEIVTSFYPLSFTTGTSELSHFKLYVQPSFGFTNNVIDIALSTRFTRLSFPKVSTSPGLVGKSSYWTVHSLNDKSHFLIEPAVTLRAGFKNVKAQIQYMHVERLTEHRYDFHSPATISIGIYIALGERLKKSFPKEQATKQHQD
ncbi:MAG: hypothetical protein ACNA7V_07130 [Bacteroidales bacterium]